MQSKIKIINSAYDLFGTFASPRNRPGFHKKKHTVGTAIAALARPRLERRKAGSTVNVGKGQSIVGTPETRRPTEAGISRHKPAIVVATPLFDIGFSEPAPSQT
jgi:hypothetical protein